LGPLGPELKGWDRLSREGRESVKNHVAPAIRSTDLNQGNLVVRVGRRDDAIKEQAAVDRLRTEHGRLNDLKASLLRSPGDDDLKAEMGRWMLDHGHDEEARRWAEDVLRRRTDHPLANQVLERYHAKQGAVGLANYIPFAWGGTPEPT
jgi:hypothetical protein